MTDKTNLPENSLANAGATTAERIEDGREFVDDDAPEVSSLEAELAGLEKVHPHLGALLRKVQKYFS